MAGMILPTIRSLFLCDRIVRYPNGKSDVCGIYTHAEVDEFPHLRVQFVIFCELTDGLGQVPFCLRIVEANRGEQLYSTPVRTIHFTDPLKTIQLVYRWQLVTFDEEGVYFIELWCDNECIADARLTLEIKGNGHVR
jgi:hypothetical protein